MSVVARPACARTGGTRVKSRVERAAAGRPNIWRVQKKTTSAARTKKGRIPARIWITKRSGFFEWMISPTPSKSRSALPEGRAPSR